MDEKKRNDEMKTQEELKLEPDVMFQALVYIELAYKEGLIDLKTYSKIMISMDESIKSRERICYHERKERAYAIKI